MAEEIKNPQRPIVLKSLDILLQQIKQDFVTNVQVNEKVQEAVKETILCDTKENWDAKIGFIPPKGTIVIYSDYTKYEDQDYPCFKVGDGNAYLIDLPFSGDDLRAALSAHIENASIHLSESDRNKLENSVKASVVPSGASGYALVLTKD